MILSTKKKREIKENSSNSVYAFPLFDDSKKQIAMFNFQQKETFFTSQKFNKMCKYFFSFAPKWISGRMSFSPIWIIISLTHSIFPSGASLMISKGFMQIRCSSLIILHDFPSRKWDSRAPWTEPTVKNERLLGIGSANRFRTARHCDRFELDFSSWKSHLNLLTVSVLVT